MKKRKLMFTCVPLVAVGLAAGAIAFTARGGTRHSTHTVFENLGYVRITGCEDLDGVEVRLAIQETAAAEKWTRVVSRAQGLDGHERAEYLYRDGTGNEIRLDWAAKEGADAVLLVSAPPAVRASATLAVWSRLMPQLLK